MCLNLDLVGICAATGSACSSSSIEPSHVLQAMGFGPERVQSSIRVSLGKYTIEEEVLQFVEALREAIGSVRSRSSAGKAVRKG